MLKFELTRFEAQDVITTSGVASSCTHSNFTVEVAYPNFNYTCTDCGATGTSGSVGTTDTIVWNK